MFRQFKNRTVEDNQRVACFWNLHEDVFSIEGRCFEREKSRKLILAHGNGIYLTDVTFTVNERLRQQVIEKRQKNVHAFVKGEFVETGIDMEDITEAKGFRQAYYNPYKVESFVDAETGKKINHAKFAVLLDKKVWYKI